MPSITRPKAIDAPTGCVAPGATAGAIAHTTRKSAPSVGIAADETGFVAATPPRVGDSV